MPDVVVAYVLSAGGDESGHAVSSEKGKMGGCGLGERVAAAFDEVSAAGRQG